MNFCIPGFSKIWMCGSLNVGIFFKKILAKCPLVWELTQLPLKSSLMGLNTSWKWLANWLLRIIQVHLDMTVLEFAMGYAHMSVSTSPHYTIYLSNYWSCSLRAEWSLCSPLLRSVMDCTLGSWKWNDHCSWLWTIFQSWNSSNKTKCFIRVVFMPSQTL